MVFQRFHSFLFSLIVLLALSSTFAALQVEAQPIGNSEVHLANEYFNDGEYEQALNLYEKLYRQRPGVDFYVYRVVDCYLGLGQTEQALEFTEKVIRKMKGRVQFKALKGKVLAEAEGDAAANAYWDKLIARELQNQNEFAAVGSFFMTQRDYTRAKETYEQARETLNSPWAFNSDLATLYRVLNQPADATEEYVHLVLQTPGIYPQVQNNVLRMVSKENNPKIEGVLLKAVQDNPRNMQLRELLYEFYLRAENYEEALVQARSLDKLNNENGNRLIRLAKTLQKNGYYGLSNNALEALLENNPNSPFFLEARVQMAKNFELKAFGQRPLDTLAINDAIHNYEELFERYGRIPGLLEAMYRKARLHVFYSDQPDSALKELEAIQNLNVPPVKKADAQLLMGDVYLLKGDYFQAERTYQQVEDLFMEGQQGAMARFRIARLNYFKGEFELAKGRLKVLKDNASNDIANDAIQLFLKIQDNMGLDSTTTALEAFADAELLAFQRKYEQALAKMDSILQQFPEHMLADDILWAKANIYLNQGNTERAFLFFDKILENHADGIYGDDALFTKAELYQYDLNQPEKAKQNYLNILMNYPASLFKVEARKRIRALRGDTEPDARESHGNHYHQHVHP